MSLLFFGSFLDGVSFNSRKAKINTFLPESLKSQVFLCISYIVTLRVTDFMHCLLPIVEKTACLSPYFKISLTLKSVHKKFSSKKLKRMYCNIIQATLLFSMVLAHNSLCLINNPMSLFELMVDYKVRNSSQVSKCPLGKIRTFMYDYYSLSSVSYTNQYQFICWNINILYSFPR